ncbi:Gfo/Idh/MocA family oxidoreductase [Polaromonas sp.]|uniref:Gfo/Idh/MocA family oxidoreductase n=1 Tax=Polaromonas sp. TaxID=1869339 RepID=UPI001D555E3B|nr:Gfo/Idh/MocA family oxidoreductase [Polaromonas sp.]MBT9477084.1 Gfo/Idh/MocA family oxidoreductase [Polaromonas sp.]
MSARVLNIGVVGLGRAFTLMLPTFAGDARVKLVAATDPIAAACRQFEKDFGTPAHDSVEALCADPRVDAVYIASPHQFHAAHVATAAAHGKHVLVEKPMALTLADCTAMIEATRRASVHLIVGHSHSFNTPVQRTRALIDSGDYGAVKMIHALNFTDFLFRPRRPEELDTSAGGGVIHSQATHQIDIVRLLGGGLVTSVRAHTGAWDASRPTEGAYSALLGFKGGAFASATYSGYGHFDSDTLLGDIGEMGQNKNPADHGAARRRLAQAHSADDESAMKAARNYGGNQYVPAVAAPGTLAHQHFGHLIVSCEKADLLPGPTGIAIYTGGQKIFEPLAPPAVPRQEVIDELYAAAIEGRPPRHSGEWARATTAVCLALLDSARTGHECRPAHQTAYGTVSRTGYANGS